MNWSQHAGNNGCKRLVYHPSGFYLALFGRHVDILNRSNPDQWTSDKIFPPAGLDTLRDWGMYSVFVGRNGWIYVTTDSGIYRSKDYPFTDWEFVARGLTAKDFRLDHFTNVSQLAQNNNTGILYAASRGQSVYRSTLPDLSVRRGGNAIAGTAVECYPNPFNGSAVIMFTNPKRQNVTVEIIDPTGAYHNVIHDDILNDGEQEIALNASELPSGAYFCRVRFADGTTSSALLHHIK